MGKTVKRGADVGGVARAYPHTEKSVKRHDPQKQYGFHWLIFLDGMTRLRRRKATANFLPRTSAGKMTSGRTIPPYDDGLRFPVRGVSRRIPDGGSLLTHKRRISSQANAVTLDGFFSPIRAGVLPLSEGFVKIFSDGERDAFAAAAANHEKTFFVNLQIPGFAMPVKQAKDFLYYSHGF